MMVKFKTVIVPRVRKIKESSAEIKILSAVVATFNIVFGTLVPFIIGFYFALTTNWWFLAALVIWLFFDIRLDINKEGTIKIKIIRGI